MCHVPNQNPVLKQFIPSIAEDNVLFARFGWQTFVLENINSHLMVQNSGFTQFIHRNWESCSVDQHILEHMYSTSYNISIDGHVGYSNQEEMYIRLASQT